MRSIRRALRDESGSSPVEFVLVGALLTLLTVGVLQLGLVVYVRNVVHDAAVEAAFHAALADTSLEDGAQRGREIISRAVGASYAHDVSVFEEIVGGAPSIGATVRTTFPVVGLLGAGGALEVTAHAPVESLD